MERNQVAINLESNRLVAVAAGVQAGRITVRVAQCAEAGDARPQRHRCRRPLGGIGTQTRETLSAARRGRVIFAVSRGEVVMKRIAFPPGTDSDELPGAPATCPSVDSLSGERGDRLRTDRRRRERRGARRRACRATASSGVARCAGPPGCVWARRATVGRAAARLRKSHKGGPEGRSASASAESTEFVIVEGGQLVFARATTSCVRRAAEETDGFAQKVAVEAKRTWMSYRARPMRR